jgi:O-antigen/teichoic acid export membrane protein
MAIARRIAYNVIFNVITKVISTALALVSIGFITRYLGKEGFGDYSTVLAFFSFFAAFADLGLYNITAREISRANADEEKILGNVFALRLISSFLVFLITPLLVVFMPYSYEVKLGIIIAAASFVFSSSYMVLNGVYQKNLAMDKVGLVELLGKVIQVSVVVLAVRKNLGFSAIIFSMLASMVFNFSLVLYWVRRYVKISLQFDFAYWKKFLKESLPMGISAIIIFIYFKVDTILLSFLKTNADVGIYNAAYKVIENVTFFPSMIIGLVLPIFSRTIFTDRKEFEYTANETAKVFFVLIVPIVIGTLFLSNGIINLIGGSAFAQSANSLRILIFALAFIFFGNFFNNILIAGSLQKKLMTTLSFCAVFNLIANLIFIPFFSYTASAIISVFTEMIVVIFSSYLVRKHLGYSIKIKHFSRIMLSGAAMAVFLAVFGAMNFFASALSAAFVYVLFLWITRTITIKELLGIFSAK